MFEQLEALLKEASAALAAVSDGEALRAWELAWIGKKGRVTEAVRGVSALPKEERAAYGKRANEIKVALESAYAEAETQVRERELTASLAQGEIDITLPGRPLTQGGLHPSTQTLRDFYRIWATMGFQVYHSRDVEDDDTNFTLLNIPPHHPAREMQDTFYTTKPNVILRTHTSPGQIRAMRQLGENGTRPIRVILPGMCYRFEQITARSEVQFHQMEGICVGRNIHMTDLKGTVAEFARMMFGANAKVRFRSSYFPFTEPSMEIDVECFLCGGEGCRICKYSGWLEIAGSGMIHPTVLENGGYDPNEWSGFAFGMGPERITMLKHAISDIRYFWANDLRFLSQF
ncbi:MAG: phenylalanine--tRNA ligase subunit alpha [Pleurocapsa minor GSE-CHR-MK-17-07R]|jgi:phenylalanyl-tRNA synthetase alpha chain|nr:phenylalanine--tRNA ligase subunit alpha [Pleurocapsa minor GSE-CHR-MK 17-07R]